MFDPHVCGSQVLTDVEAHIVRVDKEQTGRARDLT
jgi:hypothetical protein